MREQARLVYHIANNLRVAVRNAALGKDYADWQRLTKSGRVVAGPHTYGWPNIWTDPNGTERLLVGDYCSLGGTYLLGGRHAVDRLTTYPHRINWRLPGALEDGFPTPTGDTHIGSDCWICPGSFLLSGITVGDGVIIGAGSVVTKDIPPYAIVAGNPARLIRYRFNEQQIEALLEISWWDWPEAKVREAVPLIAGSDVDALVEFARSEVGVVKSAAAA